MLLLPGNLTAGSFLDRYWQKQPLFMPGALDGIRPAISRNELGWLATHDDVESRIVFVERSEQGARYRVETGPFDAQYLGELPKRDWTLLVHDVEKHLPAMRALFRHVPFIPDWRIDDLMVSFAAPGGGVGPHRDHYDVFLCQGIGIRNWRFCCGEVKEDAAASRDLALLENFDGDASHETRQGDVLYLPPGVAHWGVAKRACMTYSIGMRAPQAAELGLDSPAALADDFYRDPELRIEEATPGYLPKTAIQRAQRLLQLADTRRDDVADALGRFATQTKAWLRPEAAAPEDFGPLLAKLENGGQIDLHGMARIAFDDQRLYINGDSIRVSADCHELLRHICDSRALFGDASTVGKHADLLAWMLERGAFEIPETH